MSLHEPYYDRDGITIYHGDCRDILLHLEPDSVDLVLTDPPYGINYRSGMTGHDGGTALPGIEGDTDTSLRDYVLRSVDAPAIVFGSWKTPVPDGTRIVLTWDKGDHVGMGDLSLPWKPNTEEIYIIGSGFEGHRGSSVLRIPAPVTWNSVSFGRRHPHEKPTALILALLAKHPGHTILDPFAGSGTTLRAAKDLGRRAIGIEIELDYVKIAVERLQQETLPLAIDPVEQRHTDRQLPMLGSVASSTEGDEITREVGFFDSRKVSDG
jgi:tRNA G10  N-methylase Trm11